MPWFKHHPGPKKGLGDRCASENCAGIPSWRLEAGGVGSFYCFQCMVEIESDPHWHALHLGCPACEADADIIDRLRAYSLAIGGGPGVITNAIYEIDKLRTKMTIAQHLEQMMHECAEFDSSMNNAGFYYLGHLTADERARVSLAFDAMVRDYARRHEIAVKTDPEVLP